MNLTISLFKNTDAYFNSCSVFIFFKIYIMRLLKLFFKTFFFYFSRLWSPMKEKLIGCFHQWNENCFLNMNNISKVTDYRANRKKRFVQILAL